MISSQLTKEDPRAACCILLIAYGENWKSPPMGKG